ncbi:MAG: diaminopimelate epimerase [Bacteroidota bacterium]|nr:diaminopimelate epimerase [Bacteroidota bacterium]
MNLRFFKYQGAGNDFILLDCREHRVNLSKEQISKMCERKFGIGADGLIYLESPRVSSDHFYMVYFNADGSESTMCGNGGRCIAKFAEDLGMVADKFYFHAIDGPHWAKVRADQVALGMSDVESIKVRNGAFFVDTGSPHHVEVVEQHADDFIKFARPIRFAYGEKGANINSLVPLTKGFSIRTYERGVEDETLSCGTGAVAAAMVAVGQGLTNSPVRISTLGGELLVRFNGKGPFTEVILEGPASRSFEGVWEV